MAMTRWWTSTWVAASPIPGAEYMVSNRSSIRLASAEPNSVTGWARVRSRGSGNSRMVRTAMVYA